MVSKPKENGALGLITTKQAAELLMVSEAWIGKLHKMGYVAKAGRGKWDITALVQGNIHFLKDEDRRSSKSASASRGRDVKTEMLEMQMMEKRRELVPLEDTKLVLDTAASLTQSSLMAVPAKFTRNIQDRRRLEKLIGTALCDVADGIDKKAEALAGGGDVMEI